jgi:FtsH-binding integral membrane protein
MGQGPKGGRVVRRLGQTPFLLIAADANHPICAQFARLRMSNVRWFFLAMACTFGVGLLVGLTLFAAGSISEDGPLATTYAIIVPALVFCVVAGLAAMACSYIVLFSNRDSQWSRHLMRYGIDMVIIGMIALMLLAVTLGQEQL